MRRQSGMSAVALVAGVAVAAAAGAGFFAWQKSAEVSKLQAELSTTRQGLDKARADLKKASQELSAVSKETSQLKVAAERMSTERDSVRKVMEDQQAASVQMRADLALARDQISYLTARTSKDVVRGMPKSAR